MEKICKICGDQMCINNAVRCEMKYETFETVVTVATGGNYRIWHGEYILIS